MNLLIIQARMSSTRLPGKSLMTLGSETVLGNVIRRCQMCKTVDGVLVATSTDKDDDAIVEEAIKLGALYYRGSLDDVLDRYYKAATLYKADRIIRVTGDCPFIMPDIVDKVVNEGKNAPYASNVVKRTYPKGLDCEVFDYEELERAANNAQGEQREHVTPYIKEHAMSVRSVVDNDSNGNKRLTLDNDLDYRDLTRYYPTVGDIYKYEDLKIILPTLVGTEENSINLELGRV